MAVNRTSPSGSRIIDIPASPPTSVTATDLVSGGGVSVAFTAPSTATGGPIFSYTATSNPGSATKSGTSSPLTFDGLTVGTSYTFTVAATNPSGSQVSSASNAVTPTAPPEGTFVISSFSGAAGLKAWQWTSASGTGTQIGNASSNVNDGVGGFDISTDETQVLATNGNPSTGAGLYGFPFSSSTGFGTAYSNPSPRPPSRTNHPYFTTGSATMAFCQTDGSPYIHLYAFTPGSGFGSKFSDPSPNSGQDRGGSFAPNNLVAMSCNATYYPYAVSASGFGTRYSGLSGYGLASGNSWNPTSTVWAASMEGGSSPLLAVAWSTASGFGSVYSSPGGLSFSTSDAMAWHPDGDAIWFAGRGSMYIAPWSNSTGFGTQYSLASLNMNGTNVGGGLFSKTGATLSFNGGRATTPTYVPFSKTTGFGTVYSISGPTGFGLWKKK
jgi:hypothetical protein